MTTIANTFLWLLTIIAIGALGLKIADMPHKEILRKSGLMCSVVGGLELIRLGACLAFWAYAGALPDFLQRVFADAYPPTILSIGYFLLITLWGIYVFRKTSCHVAACGVSILLLIATIFLCIYASVSAPAVVLSFALIACIIGMIRGLRQRADQDSQ